MPPSSIPVPTSQLLAELVDDAPQDHVTLVWLTDNLQERSFGIVMLLLAVMGLVPGASGVVGGLIGVLATQMVLGHRAPVFPRFIRSRAVETSKIARALGRVTPVLMHIEKLIRPRWHTPFGVTQRVVGGFILVLGGALLVPIPLSNVPPSLVIALIALAYIEHDGVLLCAGLIAAVVVTGLVGVAAWQTLRAVT